MLGDWAKAARSRRRKPRSLTARVSAVRGGFEDLRLEACELVDEGARVQHEDAAVPEEVAVGEIALGGRGVGLLVEGIDAECGTGKAFERAALANVAVAGVGAVGLDAEQDELAGGGDDGGAADRLDELGFVADDVIGGHHREDCVGVLIDGGDGGHRDRGRGVARHRLEDDALCLDCERIELFLDEEAMVGVAEHDRWLEAERGAQALERRGEEACALAVEEMNELLGVHGPRQRPQSGARSA